MYISVLLIRTIHLPACCEKVLSTYSSEQKHPPVPKNGAHNFKLCNNDRNSFPMSPSELLFCLAEIRGNAAFFRVRVQSGNLFAHAWSITATATGTWPGIGILLNFSLPISHGNLPAARETPTRTCYPFRRFRTAPRSVLSTLIGR